MAKKSLNSSLSVRNGDPRDEFYTALETVEAEMKFYRKHWKGATVLLNCDDPYESNFFKYFAMNFNRLGLKKLIATCFEGSAVAGNQLPLFGEVETVPARVAHKIVITEVPDMNGDGSIDLVDVEELLRSGEGNVLTRLEGNGDFRSPECVALLDEADVVVTNPPFSLFTEFLNLVLEHEKKFLILGDQNFVALTGVFEHIREKRMWLGIDNGGVKWFQVPADYKIGTKSRQKIVDGVQYFSMGRIFWYTNLEVARFKEEVPLFKRYSPEEYPTYVNFDAIEASPYTTIPLDYDGLIGVPITALAKLSPDQFEIVGTSTELAIPMKDVVEGGRGSGRFYLEQPDGSFKRLYERLVIRHKR